MALRPFFFFRNMRRPRTPPGFLNIALFLALALTLTSLTEARVFRRSSSALDSHQVMLNTGGTRAYEAEVAINSGKGRLAVYSFKRDASEVSREIQRLFGATVAAPSAEGFTGVLSTRSDGRVLRFVVLQMEAGQKSVVFMLDQTEEEYESSRQPPAKNPLKDLPTYPQGTLKFFARNEDTGLSACMMNTASNPEVVQEFYRARLSQARWKQLFPLQSADGSGVAPRGAGLSIYAAGSSLCYVHTEVAGHPAETRITLLHKQRLLK